jgi:hypothetical protein
VTAATTTGAVAVPPSRRTSAVALRYATLGVGLVVLAGVHLRQRPATLCLLRATTGLPCPFCGGTTSAAALGRGDVAEAFRASIVAPLLVLLAPVPSAAGRMLRRLPRAAAWGAVLAVLTVAELWQLHRFDLL